MSYAPKTISDVFRTHGITIAIGAPMMRIQELALAISLKGDYRVGAGYRGLDHLIEVSIYERCGIFWTTKRTMAAALPNEARASALYCEGAITWAEEAARGVPPEQRIGQPDYRGIADEHCPGYRAAAQRWDTGGRQLASN